MVVLRAVPWSDVAMYVSRASFVTALSALFLLALGACSSTPVPDYPFPEPEPLEDTELAEFVMEDEEDPYAEDEEWDDGLDDEDLWDMDGSSDDAENTDGESETEAAE